MMKRDGKKVMGFFLYVTIIICFTGCFPVGEAERDAGNDANGRETVAPSPSAVEQSNMPTAIYEFVDMINQNRQEELWTIYGERIHDGEGYNPMKEFCEDKENEEDPEGVFAIRHIQILDSQEIDNGVMLPEDGGVLQEDMDLDAFHTYKVDVKIDMFSPDAYMNKANALIFLVNVEDNKIHEASIDFSKAELTESGAHDARANVERDSDSDIPAVVYDCLDLINQNRHEELWQLFGGTERENRPFYQHQPNRERQVGIFGVKGVTVRSVRQVENRGTLHEDEDVFKTYKVKVDLDVASLDPDQTFYHVGSLILLVNVEENRIYELGTWD